MKLLPFVSAMIIFAGTGLAAGLPVTTQSFGTLADGRAVTLYTLQSTTGFRVEVMDFGGTIVRLFAPDRHGKFADVVLGFPQPPRLAPKSGQLAVNCGIKFDPMPRMAASSGGSAMRSSRCSVRHSAPSREK